MWCVIVLCIPLAHMGTKPVTGLATADPHGVSTRGWHIAYRRMGEKRGAPAASKPEMYRTPFFLPNALQEEENLGEIPRLLLSRRLRIGLFRTRAHTHPFMLKWSTVKAKTKRKPELSEAAAATILAVSHKNRCMRRALSQVRDWLTVDAGRGMEGSWAEIGRTKLTSARARAQRVNEVRANRARAFESGVAVIQTAIKDKDATRCARLAYMQKSDKEIETLPQVRLQVNNIEPL